MSAVEAGEMRTPVRALACAALAALFAGSGFGQAASSPPRELRVQVGKSIVIDSPVEITRASVASPEIVEVVGISPREVLLNGKSVGQTSVIVWQQGGSRMFFDVTVRGLPDTRLEAVRAEIERELAGQNVEIAVDKDLVFLRGTVKDLASADRALALAGAVGKPVNLLKVAVPEAKAQVLLKVRFADVDRAAIRELGANWFSTGATGTIGSVATGQFSPPKVGTSASGVATGVVEGAKAVATLSDALNVFLFRPDLDLGMTLRALQSKRLVQVLAEPNVLASQDREASFLAGGEFPYPVPQVGAIGLGTIAIQFREYGIRLNFTPSLTPRGSIRLRVAPEVSSLDFVNALMVAGYTVPGINSRKVSTEIELENGQSFAIAGLLDNRTTEQLSKIPGLGDIPFFGKLFQSRALNKSNSELLVMVTPEIVKPLAAGQPVPNLEFPAEFMKGSDRNPATMGSAPAPARPGVQAMPVEVLREELKKLEAGQEQRRGSAQTGMAGSYAGIGQKE